MALRLRSALRPRVAVIPSKMLIITVFAQVALPKDGTQTKIGAQAKISSYPK